MELHLVRQAAIGDAWPGDFYVDGTRYAFALERVSTAIPPGRYPLRFTYSDRAQRGELWSPDPLHRLPLVDEVPGRSGIRIHAANEYDELEGCIALAKRRAVDRLVLSRAAVEPFIDLVRETIAQAPIWISIVVAPADDATRKA